jgi:hypothetical protein
MVVRDPRKAALNVAKHGVSFDEAVSVFLDARLGRSRRAACGRRGQISSTWALGGWTSPDDCLHRQEKWQWRNDPYHQRAPREPA